MSAAPFSELASEREAMSWAGIDPTKVLGRRRGRWCLVMVRNGEVWKASSAQGGGAWGWREGGLSSPKSVPSMQGARIARRRWMGADGDGGSEGRGN